MITTFIHHFVCSLESASTHGVICCLLLRLCHFQQQQPQLLPQFYCCTKHKGAATISPIIYGPQYIEVTFDYSNVTVLCLFSTFCWMVFASLVKFLQFFHHWMVYPLSDHLFDLFPTSVWRNFFISHPFDDNKFNM